MSTEGTPPRRETQEVLVLNLDELPLRGSPDIDEEDTLILRTTKDAVLKAWSLLVGKDTTGRDRQIALNASQQIQIDVVGTQIKIVDRDGAAQRKILAQTVVTGTTEVELFLAAAACEFDVWVRNTNLTAVEVQLGMKQGGGAIGAGAGWLYSLTIEEKETGRISGIKMAAGDSFRYLSDTAALVDINASGTEFA